MEIKIGQVWVDNEDGETIKILSKTKKGWMVEIIRNFCTVRRAGPERILEFGDGFQHSTSQQDSWRLDESSTVNEILERYGV